MASNKTVRNIIKFMDFGFKLNILPIQAKINASTNVTLKIIYRQKYIVSTFFAITVKTASILAFLKALLFNTNSIGNEGIVFMLAVVSMALVILGTQLWLVCKLESIVSLIATFLRFNQSLCKLI